MRSVEEVEERTRVDEGPPFEPASGAQRNEHDSVETMDRWEEKTHAERGAQRTPPRGNVTPIRRAAAGKHVTFLEDDDEPTVQADEQRLANGTSELGASTIDEPTVEDQAQPLPPLSVVPPAPADAPRRPAAPRIDPKKARLVVIAGNDSGRNFALTGRRIVVGRGIDNAIVLTDIAVSRRHMELDFLGDSYIVRDLRSGNGTLVNDQEAEFDCVLKHGDRIELGNTVFRFEHPASQQQQRLSGWGQVSDDPDDEASTIAGRRPPQLPIPGKRPTLPPPRRDGLVLPAQPPGATLSPPAAEQRSLNAPGRDAKPDGDQLDSSGSLPFLANAVALPGGSYGEALYHQAHALQPRSSRKVMVGVISSLIAIVVIAIGAIVLTDDDPPPGGAHRSALAGEAPVDSKAAPAPKTTTKTNPEPSARLPVSTWGTNEVVLASHYKLKAPSVTPAPSSNDTDPADSKKPAPADKPGEDNDPDKGSSNTPAKADDTKPGDTKADTKVGDTKGDASNPDGAKVKIVAATKPDKVAAVSPARRTTLRRPLRRITRPRWRSRRVNVAPLRRRAAAQYRSKQFSAAAQVLRNAANLSGVTKPDVAAMRSMATTYEAVGANLARAAATTNSNPTAAMAAYRRALRLDQSAGNGAHAAFIRIKLGVVAPKAAASYMAQGRYEAAKKAADAAVNYGSGGSPLVRRVRLGLSRKAAEFYRSAVGLRSRNQLRAKLLLRRILKMVSAKDVWYQRAYKLLNAR